MKNKTYNLKVNKDELEVLEQSLYEYYSLLTDCNGKFPTMRDEFKTVQNRIKHMIVKINESERGL